MAGAGGAGGLTAVGTGVIGVPVVSDSAVVEETVVDSTEGAEINMAEWIVNGSVEIDGAETILSCDGGGSGKTGVAASGGGSMEATAIAVELASVTASAAAGVGFNRRCSRSAIRSATNCSVSRQPVPLPIAMTEI